MMQKYSKFSLFFQVQRPLQTFAKPLRCFTTRCNSRLQHFIYRSPTCSSRHAAPSTAPSAHKRLSWSLPSSCRFGLQYAPLEPFEWVGFHFGIPPAAGRQKPPLLLQRWLILLYFSFFYYPFIKCCCHATDAPLYCRLWWQSGA